MQHGVEFLASYTLAKGTTNNRGFYGVGGGSGLQGVTGATEGAYWQNTYDPEAEWGPMFHDVRHNMILSGTFDLPFGTGRRYGADWSPLRNAVISGWRLGGILQARSGLPVTVTDGRAPSLQGDRGSERLNCVGNWKPGDQSVTQWLDITGFAAGVRHLGTVPLVCTRAAYNLDMVLSKNFATEVRDMPNSGLRRSNAQPPELVHRRDTRHRIRSGRSRPR
jgi:hypothetical protein